jgi:hypothetical protein
MAPRRFQFRLRTLFIVVTLLAINAALLRTFGPPFISIQTVDGREIWGVNEATLECLFCEVLVAGVVVLNIRFPRT